MKLLALDIGKHWFIPCSYFIQQYRKKHYYGCMHTIRSIQNTHTSNNLEPTQTFTEERIT